MDRGKILAKKLIKERKKSSKGLLPLVLKLVILFQITSAELIFSITVYVVVVRPEAPIHTQRTLFLSLFLSFE